MKNENKKLIALFYSAMTLYFLLAFVQITYSAPLWYKTDIDLYISTLIKPLHKHPLKKESKKHELVKAIDTISKKYQIHPAVFVAMGWKETQLREGLVGSVGERGIIQVFPATAKTFHCPSFEQLENQIDCGARILKAGINKCGTLKGGLTFYGSNKGACKSKAGSRLSKAVMRRLKLIERLKNG